MPNFSHSELTILRALSANAPSYTSGAALARQLGISRVAIWQYMEKLRAQGFSFEGKRSCGYRLAKPPPEINATYIEVLLNASERGVTFSVLDSVDSTNDEATRQLAQNTPTPFVVLAREQTKGRGRFNRHWASGKHGNLYASFAFRPELSPQRMPTFTLWMGVTICELIHTLFGLTPKIKWPNDIVFDGRKCGGILTEARIDVDQMRDLVFGLGLNVNQAARSWGKDLQQSATSLRIEAGRELDLNHLAAAVIGRTFLAYSQFVSGRHAPLFAPLWEKHDALRGSTITVLNGTQRITGEASGIDESGNLLLRVNDSAGSSLQRFAAGEVTLGKSI